MLIRHITDLIGNTPMLEIDPLIHGFKNINLYAKLEIFNPFGSLKDRSAWNILKDEFDSLKANSQTVVEASSGNMSKAMQVLCAMQDIPYKVVTNRIKVKEVKQILQLLGAELEELPGTSECHDPTDPNDPVFIIQKMMSTEPGKYFYTSQYSNIKNQEAHYKGTGPEIYSELGSVDIFIGSLGTTGSTGGTGKFLKEKNPNLKIIGVVGKKGQILPGIRNLDEMYEVGLFNKDFYDQIVTVGIDESIDSMLTLIKSCGILAGPTSGGCLAAALNYLSNIDTNLQTKINVVFIVCDRVEWYLSYLQKARPSLFGIGNKKDILGSLTEEDIATAPEIAVDEAEKWLEQEANPLIIDTRGSIAFKSSRLPKSTNIPAEYLVEMVNWGMPFSKNQSVLLICPTGDQSRKFSALLHSHGIRCASLKGGFLAWRDARKPLERAMVNIKSASFNLDQTEQELSFAN